MSDTAKRYTAVAIVLHWAIALAIACQIALGWWMHEAIEDAATRAQAVSAFQLHKSVGLTVLALSFVRLLWRFTHKPPPYPAHMPAWEKLAARVSHWGLYALMLLMPLTGWLYVSTSWSHEADHALNVPTIFFGLFEVPHLFNLNQLGDGARAALSELFIESHELLAWGAIVLAAVHVGAALKHHLLDRDDVLAHMAPGLKPLAGPTPEPPAERLRAPILIGGFAATLLALVAGIAAFSSPPHAPTALAQVEQQAPAAETTTTAIAETTTAETTTTAPNLGTPPAWRVNQGASSIRFAGEHAGVPFEGRFTRWRARIAFDPNNLDASSALVTVEMASATDGNPLHEETLPQAEWFDTAAHPTATFNARRIRARGDGRYEARGVFTFRGEPHDIDLPFTLTINGDRAVMDGRVTLDRRELGIGMESDPDAEWVSREIAVTIHVEATRQ